MIFRGGNAPPCPPWLRACGEDVRVHGDWYEHIGLKSQLKTRQTNGQPNQTGSQERVEVSVTVFNRARAFVVYVISR